MRARNKTHLEPLLTLSRTQMCVQCAQCGGDLQDEKMCVRQGMLSSPPVACTTFANVCTRKKTVKTCPHSLITISVLPVVRAIGDLPTECLPIERLATDFASTTRKKKKMMRSVLRSILRNVHWAIPVFAALWDAAYCSALSSAFLECVYWLYLVLFGCWPATLSLLGSRRCLSSVPIVGLGHCTSSWWCSHIGVVDDEEQRAWCRPWQGSPNDGSRLPSTLAPFESSGIVRLSSTWPTLKGFCFHCVSQPLSWPGDSEWHGSLRSIVVSSLFGFGFLVSLGNNGSPRSIISSTYELDTGTGWESVPLRSSLPRVSLSLNTVVVGEVDELEEDVGW